MAKVKWGIIGTGGIANLFAEALAGCEDAELTAVASRTLGKAQAFAEKFGFGQAYGSYRELAENSDADVVYIATPMSCHFADSMLCLKNGKNVLCEKSVTINSAQLEILLDTAKAEGLFFMEAMWMKCRPAYLAAREWVKNGRIGDIRYIKADFSNALQYHPDSRLYRPDCGGGALLDLTVYPLTLAADFLGMPDNIVSRANMDRGIDISNSLILSWKNGAYASMDCGFEMRLKNNAMISGTGGFILFGEYFHCTEDVALYDRDGVLVEKLHIPNRINGYEYEIDEVHRCLAEKRMDSELVPHSGTVEIMKIMDRLRSEWGLVYPEELEENGVCQ